MAIDVNRLIELNTAISEVPRPNRFLRNRFFGGREIHIEKYTYGYDVIKGKKTIAPFVGTEIGFKHIPRGDVKTLLYDFPLIAPLDVITENDVSSRMPGEAIGGGMTPAQRQERDRTRRIALLDDMITRTEEAMIGELLRTGIMTITGDGVNTTIDLTPASVGWTAITDITDGTQDWDAATPAPTILADLRNWKNDIRNDSGIVPDTVILGDDAAAAFLEDTAVLAMLDNRRALIGEINYADIEGAEYLGRIWGMDVFAYSDGYVNAAGSTVNFIDADYCIIGASAARVPEQTMVYGPYQDVVSNTTFLQSRILVPGEGDSITNVAKWKLVARPLPLMPYVKSWRSYRVTD